MNVGLNRRMRSIGCIYAAYSPTKSWGLGLQLGVHD